MNEYTAFSLSMLWTICSSNVNRLITLAVAPSISAIIHEFGSRNRITITDVSENVLKLQEVGNERLRDEAR